MKGNVQFVDKNSARKLAWKFSKEPQMIDH